MFYISLVAHLNGFILLNDTSYSVSGEVFEQVRNLRELPIF